MFDLFAVLLQKDRHNQLCQAVVKHTQASVADFIQVALLRTHTLHHTHLYIHTMCCVMQQLQLLDWINCIDTGSNPMLSIEVGYL